MAIVMISSLYQ